MPARLPHNTTPSHSLTLLPACPPPTHTCACPLLQQIELPKLSLDKFTDSYFKAAEDKQKGKKGEDEFFKKGECRQQPCLDRGGWG